MAQQNARFTYEFADGGKVTLPRFDKVMTIGLARKARHHGESEIGWLLLEKAADDKALEVIDEQSMDQFQEFMTAWQEDSGISVGESSGSSKS